MNHTIPSPATIIATLETAVAGLDAWADARPDDARLASAQASAREALSSARIAFAETREGIAIPPYPGKSGPDAA